MCYVLNRGGFHAGRRQKCEELSEVAFVAAQRVRGGVAHDAQVRQELIHRGFHFSCRALIVPNHPCIPQAPGAANAPNPPGTYFPTYAQARETRTNIDSENITVSPNPPVREWAQPAPPEARPPSRSLPSHRRAPHRTCRASRR